MNTDIEQKFNEINETILALHQSLRDLGCDGIISYVSYKGRMFYETQLDNQSVINMSVIGLKKVLEHREKLMQTAETVKQKVAKPAEIDSTEDAVKDITEAPAENAIQVWLL